MNAVPESIMDRLRKIDALAQSGVAGERENARKMIRALCKKYGVTLEQISADTKFDCWFTITGAHDERLLLQVVGLITGTSSISYWRKGKRRRKFELTKTEEIDVRECLAHYRKAWKKQVQETLSAFIQVNRIVAPRGDDDEPQELTPEEIARLKRLAQLMAGMDARPWKKVLRLEGGRA